MTASPTVKHVAAGVLRVAYEDSGPPDGPPVFLMHGFPYDPRAYDGVAPRLAAAGLRVIVPYLRGFGPTRFLAPDTPRSGQQAALAFDLRALMDALAIPKAALAGYDWGGRAACIVAALWPERARCLVTVNGYNVHDIPGSAAPAAPAQERALWYQYYFHGERGRAGLQANRRELCRLLWQLWSPNWAFDEATFERTAASFDNPDFVDVVVHSYRHRYGYAPGDPALEDIERQLTRQPPISVPTVALHGEGDGIWPPTPAAQQARFFTGPYASRVIPVVGHNVPQESPALFADAILELMAKTR